MLQRDQGPLDQNLSANRIVDHKRNTGRDDASERMPSKKYVQSTEDHERKRSCMEHFGTQQKLSPAAFGGKCRVQVQRAQQGAW